MAIKPDKVQGEGDYEAAKMYNDATKKFVQSGRVAASARDAAPKTDAEAADMKRAEKAVLLHGVATDPIPGLQPSPKGPDPKEPARDVPKQDPQPDPIEKKAFQRIGRNHV